MSWNNWGHGTKVVVSKKDHAKYGEVGVIQAHIPTENEFSVGFDDGEILSIEPEGLIAFEAKDNIEEEPEECYHTVDKEPDVEDETAAETLLRLACRDEGVTLHQLCEERGSNVKGPFQRCINANIRKGLIVERGNGVYFTTGSAMRESIRKKQTLPMNVLGQKEYVTKEELARIFEQMARMLR